MLPWSLVIAALVGLVWIGARHASSRGSPIAPDDPLWTAAIQQARASVPAMLQLHEGGREVWVKFPLRGSSGEIEHVWGRIVSADTLSLECTVETRPIGGSVAPRDPARVSVEELEDWQVELEDGAIRGGFTTRAQAAIAEREGYRVPRHVREMLRRMTG